MKNKFVKKAVLGKCEICGYDRYLEACHIVPKNIGGGYTEVNIIILCPNHHKLFDYFLLNDEELSIIEHRIIPLTKHYANNIKIQEYLYAVLRINTDFFYKSRRTRMLGKKDGNKFL